MEDDEYYLPGDFIGKLGVERSYEKQLRGEKGVEVLLRDAHGRIQGNYMEGKFDKAPVPGKNLTLSLDIELQMLGEKAAGREKLEVLLLLSLLRVRYYALFHRQLMIPV